MVSLLSAILSSSFALAAGFSGGSIYEAVPVEGRVLVICHEPGRTESIYKYCTSEILFPYEMDHFVNDHVVDGDKIEITSVQKSGSKEKQTRRYSSDKKRSTSHFNLWVRTITQSPLLDYGANNLSYKIKKGKSVVETGEFQVEVQQGKPRECRPATRHYSSEIYCRGSDLACDDYFREENFCE